MMQAPFFHAMCLSNLKGNRALQLVALSSLSRLTWVYMVRFHGEDNVTTETRVRQIFEGLFPSNHKSLVPREAPLLIFVRIVSFVAQVRSGPWRRKTGLQSRLRRKHSRQQKRGRGLGHRLGGVCLERICKKRQGKCYLESVIHARNPNSGTTKGKGPNAWCIQSNGWDESHCGERDYIRMYKAADGRVTVLKEMAEYADKQTAHNKRRRDAF